MDNTSPASRRPSTHAFCPGTTIFTATYWRVSRPRGTSAVINPNGPVLPTLMSISSVSWQPHSGSRSTVTGVAGGVLAVMTRGELTPPKRYNGVQAFPIDRACTRAARAGVAKPGPRLAVEGESHLVHGATCAGVVDTLQLEACPGEAYISLGGSGGTVVVRRWKCRGDNAASMITTVPLLGDDGDGPKEIRVSRGLSVHSKQG